MKKIILIYLYTVNLQDIVVRIFYGKLSDYALHPGDFIKGSILLILIIYYFERILSKKVKSNSLTLSVVFFGLFYLVHLLIIEVAQLNYIYITGSITFTFKIFLLLVIAYYVYENYEYFQKRGEKILIINAVIVLLNILIGHWFNLGWTSYERELGENFRGFMAGNDTSIFTFVSFGVALYARNISKFLKYFLLIGSIYAIYIVSSKAIFGFVILLFLYNYKNISKKYVFVFVNIIIIGAIAYSIIVFDVIETSRLFKNYISSLQRVDSFSIDNDSFFYYLNFIAPGRAYIAYTFSVFFITNLDYHFLLGYGVDGIYEYFGRPPMMDFFNLIAYFGIIGGLIIMRPQFFAFIRTIKSRNFDLIGALFLLVFMYGMLGGFLHGVANTSSIYALLFGLTYYREKHKISQ